MRLTGLRGVGKTVLLGEFALRAEGVGWLPAPLELRPAHNTDEKLREVVGGIAERAKLQASKVERAKAAIGTAVTTVRKHLNFTWNDVTIGFADLSEKKSADIAKTLYDLCAFAYEQGREGVVLLLDEAQVIRDEKERAGQHPLSDLISSVVALQRQGAPLALVLCGLPTLTGNLLRARSYTERMFRAEEIGSLGEEEARKALMEPLRDQAITAHEDVVGNVVAEVEGYPYFVQLWGAELWDAAEAAGSPLITPRLFSVTTPDIYRRLDKEFYEPRIETLTPAEQDLLLSTVDTADYPPLMVAEVKEHSDKSPGNINVLLGRMVEAGVLYRLRKGQYDYTAPKFRQYLKRRTGRLQGAT